MKGGSELTAQAPAKLPPQNLLQFTALAVHKNTIFTVPRETFSHLVKRRTPRLTSKNPAALLKNLRKSAQICGCALNFLGIVRRAKRLHVGLTPGTQRRGGRAGRPGQSR